MFDTMLVSTTRRGVVRTPLFLIGTAAVWMLTFAAVVVIGIVMYDAKVSAESNDLKIAAIVPPAAPAPPPRSEVTVIREQPVADTMVSVRQPPTRVSPPTPRPASTGFDGRGLIAGNGNTPFGSGPGDGNFPDGIEGPVTQPPPINPPEPPVVEEKKPTPPKVLRVSDLRPSKTLRRVEPTYPPIAKQIRAQGAVVVEVTVSETGKVIATRVMSGHPALRDAAELAAKRWEFSPTILTDVPVKVVGTITFNFKIE